MAPLKLFRACIFVVLSATAALAEPRFSLQAAGADEDLRDALSAASLLLATRGEDTDAQELLAAAQADYARLLGTLYANARYGGVISIRFDGREVASIPPLSPPRDVREVSLRIDPGPIYLFSQAQVGPVPSNTEVPEGFRRGLPAETGIIQETATAAVEAWRTEGHAKAKVTDQRIVARHVEDRLAAVLTLTPGPKLRFGNIAITSNKDVRTARIRTIAGLEAGQEYDPAEIDRAVRRLRRTGSFASVNIAEADAIGPNETLPLAIEVVEQTPRRFGFGAEYSTIEGVRLSGFWLHRNFLGGAERFRVDTAVAGLGGETGGVDYSFGARYERPATPRADVDLFAELSFERLDEPDFTSDTTEFVLGFTRYATDELVVTFGLGYLYSDVTDDFGRETFTLLTLPLGAELDRRNDVLNATDGFFIDLEVTPFMGLSGTSSGGQLKLDARGYQDITDNLTLAARVQLGSLWGPSLAESPPFYRFYSGGGGTVRGQDYQNLGVEVGGNRTGGRSFLGVSGELRAGVTDDIDVVGFADWGYIGAEEFPDFTGESHAGAGIGLRYNTGIGPIRLDLATPVYGPGDSNGLFIYVGIGQAF
ncbi:MAG: BamA/TamA family outer membrane protein [Paracoccaceae bacterium]